MTLLFTECHVLKVITDDEHIIWMANKMGVEVVTLETMGEFDLFFCVHGNQIIDEKYLVEGRMFNIHPCLEKYPGHNPIRKYILNQDAYATVECQHLIKEVDAGEVIHVERFHTGKVSSYAEFYNIALPFYYRCIETALDKIKFMIA